MPWIILGIIISYLIGSIPTAYLFGRLLKGVDIRKLGSGNVGATNAMRVLGKPAGILVLILDILKGLCAVVFWGDFIAPRAAGFPGQVVLIILGISCICGHNWTVFLQFKGGKGVATSLGVLLGLALRLSGLKLVVGLVVLTWVIIFLITRIVSVSSLVAGISLPIYMILFKQTPVMVISSIILCVFLILRHRANLQRLFQGKESRLK